MQMHHGSPPSNLSPKHEWMEVEALAPTPISTFKFVFGEGMIFYIIIITIKEWSLITKKIFLKASCLCHEHADTFHVIFLVSKYSIMYRFLCLSLPFAWPEFMG